jgi:hypothetical protein
MTTLSTLQRRAAEWWKSFDEDEEGMEALQVVIIVAVAAVVIAILYFIFTSLIYPWFKGEVSNVTQTKGNAVQNPE